MFDIAASPNMLRRNQGGKGLIAEHVEEIHKSHAHGFFVRWPSDAKHEACTESPLIGSLPCISASAIVSPADESFTIGVGDLTSLVFALVLDDILS